LILKTVIVFYRINILRIIDIIISLFRYRLLGIFIA